MFKDKITRGDLWLGPDDQILPNISGDNYFGDVSFVATLSALLNKKIPEEDTLTFEMVSVAADSLQAVALEKLLEQVPAVGKANHFTVCRFIGCEMFTKDCWDEFQWVFCGTHPDYEVLDKVSFFYKGAFGVKAFINRQTKSVVLFVDSLCHQIFHYLQVCIVACMPWYFAPQSMTDDDMNLLGALRQKNSTAYKVAIRQVVMENIRTR